MAKAPRTRKRTTRTSVTRKQGKPALTAKNADRYTLYQASVQEPDVDLDVIDKVFKKTSGRLPARMREDFCGTALTASRFVQRRATNTALGVDLDPVPLAWGRKHIVSKLTPGEAQRLTMSEADVMSEGARKAGPFDVILAFNFSYWIFTQRETLKAYFKQARAALGEGGIFFLDCMAGSDVMIEQEERTRKKGFVYVWDQRSYDPLTGAMRCTISFEFPNGSRMKDAFVYDWRLWTMPEIRDLLHEAGFKTVETYIEGEDKKGEGTGEYVKVAGSTADRCILTYIVARG